MMLLEWVPEGLNTGALSGAKASSSRTRDSISISHSLNVYFLSNQLNLRLESALTLGT
jgi:hypothetical protein